MTSVQWLKIIGGAALLWYGVLRGARGLIIKVKDYTFRGVDLDNGIISLNLNMYVKNPLFIGLTLNGIKGDIYAQGQHVGVVNTVLDYHLSGGHTHIIPIVANLSMGGLLNAGNANIQSGDVRTLTMAFDGKLFVGSYSVAIPVRVNLDYNDLVG